QDAVYVDANQVQRHSGVVAFGDPDLPELGCPVADPVSHHISLLPGNPGPDRAVVERGQLAGSQVPQRWHGRRQRCQQQRLDQSVIGMEGSCLCCGLRARLTVAGSQQVVLTDSVLLQQRRAKLALVELLCLLELCLELLCERLVTWL